jgi:hypothetical protein
VRQHMFFTGDTGDSGDNPINTGVRSVPTSVLATGDTGDNPKVKAGTGEFVPTVPTEVLASGDTFQAIKSGLSPLSPLSPLKTSRGAKS